MVREREHHLLCLYGKGGRALLDMFIWYEMESTRYAYLIWEGVHYLCAYGMGGRALLVMLIWQGRESTTCYACMAREGEPYLLRLNGKGGRALLAVLIWQWEGSALLVMLTWAPLVMFTQKGMNNLS